MIWLRSIAAIIACMLTSCLDCREEIWLAADGSGRVDISYTFPAAAAAFQGGEDGIRKMLGKLLADTQEIHSTSCEVTTLNDRLTIRVRASFDSALDLKDSSAQRQMHHLPSSAAGLTGKIGAKLRGRSIDFKRTISPGAALPGSRFMPATRFRDHRLVYIIHLPLAASESNATRIEHEGKTLIWDFPLYQAIQKPVTTHFVAPIPIPRWVMPTVISGAVIGVGLVMLAIEKLIRPRRPRGPISPLTKNYR